MSVAAAAAAFGVPTVLIEKGKMGGDCLNYGCVPSKALLAAAKRAAAPPRALPFGIKSQRVQPRFRQGAGARAQRHRGDRAERFEGALHRRSACSVIQGAARFKDATTVAVGDTFEMRARRFVIATGSSPALPPIPGLDEVPYFTNETIFDIKRLSRTSHHHRRAAPIGLELAQALRRLGATVTVLEAANAARQGRSRMRRDRA